MSGGGADVEKDDPLTGNGLGGRTTGTFFVAGRDFLAFLMMTECIRAGGGGGRGGRGGEEGGEIRPADEASHRDADGGKGTGADKVDGTNGVNPTTSA